MDAKGQSVIAYETVFVASDHAGLEMKQKLMAALPELPWKDLGTHKSDSVDYPDFATKLCKELKGQLPSACGVLICGSGQGMAIQANRFSFVRAALCWSEEVAQLARQHNDANVLCLSGRLIEAAKNTAILKAFLATPFEGGRHQKRLDKITSLMT